MGTFVDAAVNEMKSNARKRAKTHDVQVETQHQSTLATDEKHFRLVKAQGQVRSYHPRMARVTIALEEAGGDRLVCHYAPSTFTETEQAEYKEVGFRNGSIVPIQYVVTKPRKWQMQLLFNDIGEALPKTGKVRSTEESIDWLMDAMRPRDARLWGGRGWAYVKEAAVLVVFLTSYHFKCVLTNMSVKRLAIHPLTRKTMRATVDVTFTEYVESPYRK